MLWMIWNIAVKKKKNSSQLKGESFTPLDGYQKS